MRNSRYTLAHALAASLCVLAPPFLMGFANYWRMFVHGLQQVMTPDVLASTLLDSTLLFGGVLLVLWAFSFLVRRPPAATGCPGKGSGVLLAVFTAVPVTALALGLNWLGSAGIEWLTQVKPAEQELVKCFTDGHYSLAMRAVLMGAVLVQAPLLEEMLFRGVIFRGFCRSMPTPAAMLVSGAVFALAHVNAASFIALWFLGVFFADLYRRTGTILAPMTAHFLFNATNLVLLFVCPDATTGN